MKTYLIITLCLWNLFCFAQNVGIGITSPLYKLHVENMGYGLVHSGGGSAASIGTYADNNAGWLGTVSNHPLYFYTNNSISRMMITPSGKIGIGTTTPHSSSILDIRSTSAGVLLPHMNLTQRNSITTPDTSLLIYQTNSTPGFYFYNGNAWIALSSALNTWGLSGNAGTNPVTHFIGTTDNAPLRFRMNNLWAGEWNAINNNYSIGLNSGISVTTGKGNVSMGNAALKNNVTGSNLVAIGDSALYLSNVITGRNVAVGSKALYSTTTGTFNVALGHKALYTNTSGSYNVALGEAALTTNVDGASNNGIGLATLGHNISGNYNVGMGTNALYWNTTGNENTALGTNAMWNNTTGNKNTAIGTLVLNSNTTGYSNVAVGCYALYLNSTLHNMVAIGDSALYSVTGGTGRNTAIGSKSMFSTNTGSSNAALGYKSLYSNTSGSYNVALGDNALTDNLTGISNVAIGLATMGNNESGNHNTGVGTNALYHNISGIENTALGSNAMWGSTASSYNTGIGVLTLNSSTGYSNVAVGHSALNLCGSAHNLVAVGDSSLYNQNGGLGMNTAVGSKSLYANTTGNNDAALGFHTLKQNTTGTGNTAIGSKGMFTNTTGNQNTTLGFEAAYSSNTDFGTYLGYQAGRNTNGFSNTYLGWGAGTDAANPVITTGSNNVCIGVRTGQTISSGNQNIIIGNLEDVSVGTLFNTIAIGFGMDVSQSNSVLLGNTGITKWGFGTNAGAANVLEFNSAVTTARLTTGGVWTNASDRNLKTNFISLDKSTILEKIMMLPITRWSYLNEAEGVFHIGPMAQDFYQLFGTGDDDKTISTIDPAGIALVGVQELQHEIEDLKKQVAELKQLLEEVLKNE